jgi:hypothetical protein
MDVEKVQYRSCLTTARLPTLKSQNIFFGYPLPQGRYSCTKEAESIVDLLSELLCRAAQEGGWFSYLDLPISFPDRATKISVSALDSTNTHCLNRPSECTSLSHDGERMWRVIDVC